MAERELWFKARFPDRGTGYTVAHWKGAAVIGFYGGVMTVGLVAPLFLFSTRWAAIAAAAVVVAVSTAGLLAVIRARSDWNG